MGTIIYFIKETFRGFFQASLMTFVSILTIALTLFFLGCLTIGTLNLRLWYDDAENKAGIVVAYLEDKLYDNATKRDDLINKIKGYSEVDTVLLIDKDEAWIRFENNYGSQMLEAIDDNPLPGSLEIRLSKDQRSSESAEALKDKLELLPGIEGLNYQHKWLKSLKKFRNIFYWIAIILIPIFIITLYVMIANTIRLTIYARKDLITNMHFVGATEFYIKTPFVLEGMLQGLIGGLIGVLFLYIVKLSLFRFSLYWGEGYFSPAILLVGVLFGWIGSMSAVRRFLV